MLYQTILAKDVEIYVPRELNDQYVLVDEDDFEEPELIGKIKAEVLPLMYEAAVTSKAVEVRQGINTPGSARGNEINEYDPDTIRGFYIQTTEIPLQTVIRYNIPISLTDTAVQTITLVKVGTQTKGNPPFIDPLHQFVPFHGDLPDGD